MKVRQFHHISVTHLIIITEQQSAALLKQNSMFTCTSDSAQDRKFENRGFAREVLLRSANHAQYSSTYIWKCCRHVIITTVVCVNINTCTKTAALSTAWVLTKESFVWFSICYSDCSASFGHFNSSPSETDQIPALSLQFDEKLD